MALRDELSDIPVAWRAEQLRTGSAVARIAPPPGSKEGRRLRLAVDSLSAVQQGSGLSDDWKPDAIKIARRIVEHGQAIDGKEDWVPPRLLVVVDSNKHERSVELTPELGDFLRDLQPFERRMPGAVRGELVGLNVSRVNRASIRLPTERIVRVGFETALRGDLKDALYQQVELSGLVRQDGDGRVLHIRAEGVEVLVKPEVRWSDLVGIDPAYTKAFRPRSGWRPTVARPDYIDGALLDASSLLGVVQGRARVRVPQDAVGGRGPR